MTCIIAIEHDNKVYMGADSSSNSNWDQQVTSLSKVFITGNFIIGYTSSFRMGQLLEYNLDVPEQKKEEDLRYLVTQFVPAVRECLKLGGFTRIEWNQESGGSFIVGYKGKAYKVFSDFQINRMAAGYAAVGTGEQYALGALATMKIANPEASIKKALEVAGQFCSAVCGPYHVKSL